MRDAAASVENLNRVREEGGIGAVPATMRLTFRGRFSCVAGGEMELRTEFRRGLRTARRCPFDWDLFGDCCFLTGRETKKSDMELCFLLSLVSYTAATWRRRVALTVYLEQEACGAEPWCTAGAEGTDEI